jgi:hypothetical protein
VEFSEDGFTIRAAPGEARASSPAIDFEIREGHLSLFDRRTRLRGEGDPLLERGEITWDDRDHFRVTLTDGARVGPQQKGTVYLYVRRPNGAK